jgi:hypothetical protein
VQTCTGTYSENCSSEVSDQLPAAVNSAGSRGIMCSTPKALSLLVIRVQLIVSCTVVRGNDHDWTVTLIVCQPGNATIMRGQPANDVISLNKR